MGRVERPGIIDGPHLPGADSENCVAAAGGQASSSGKRVRSSSSSGPSGRQPGGGGAARSAFVTCLGKTLGQFAHELSARQTCELMAPLCLGNQPAEHLHCVEVIPAKVLGQLDQWESRACLGKGCERIVTALAGPSIQADLPVALPGTILARRFLPGAQHVSKVAMPHRAKTVRCMWSTSRQRILAGLLRTRRIGSQLALHLGHGGLVTPAGMHQESSGRQSYL